MQNPFAKVDWLSPNLSLKFLSVGVFIAVAAALLFPHLREFLLGLALSWSGIVAFQIFTLKPMEDSDRDKDLITQLNLRS
jgi:hypothetical protein